MTSVSNPFANDGKNWADSSTSCLVVAMTAFEFLVAVLQAYIFTILTAVYVNESIHPEH